MLDYIGGQMNIKFSHAYQKLLDSHNDVIESATLLYVSLVDLRELLPVFIAYDTDNGKYKLPEKGKYLMLIFLKPHESYTTDLNLFTTLRRFTPEKAGYYGGAIGKEFEIIVTSDVETVTPSFPFYDWTL